MYCFLNYFSFEEPLETITDADVINTLMELSLFLKLLKDNDMQLIINQNLSQCVLNGKVLKEHIQNITNMNIRLLLMSKITNYHPFCSDTDTSYEYNEDIMLNNCHEEFSKIDILENFLACSLYYNSPILTPDLLCQKQQFLDTEITIVCDNEILKIDNLLLSKSSKLLDEYLSKHNMDLYTKINNWNEYQLFVNEKFEYVEILDDCIDDLKKYSFTSIQGRNVIEDIEKINTFIFENGKNPEYVHYKQLSKHINKENDDKLIKRKSKLTRKDKDGNSKVMSWHTRIGDYRLYFYFDSSKVYFSLFTSKIPE